VGPGEPPVQHPRAEGSLIRPVGRVGQECPRLPSACGWVPACLADELGGRALVVVGDCLGAREGAGPSPRCRVGERLDPPRRALAIVAAC